MKTKIYTLFSFLLSTLLLLPLSSCEATGEEPEYDDTATGELIEITGEELRELVTEISVSPADPSHEVERRVIKLKEPKPTIIEFYRPDCPHCVSLKPHLVKLAAAYKGRVPVYVVHTRSDEEVREIVSELRVTFVPTLFFVHRRGEAVMSRPSGAKDPYAVMAEETERMIASYAAD